MEIMEKDELQRAIMTRKSLASQTSLRAAASQTSQRTDEEFVTDSIESGWKEHEANLHKDRSLY